MAGISSAKVTCVILQPSYIPWRGYFHQIQKADTFVFYDDVQYDHNGWRNRNRIKTSAGAQWLTIPVRALGERWQEMSINDTMIAEPDKWRRSHFETIRHSYRKTPYFERYRAMLERWYGARQASLAEFTIQTTTELARELRIEKTRFLRSSELGVAGSKTERLLGILQRVGATHYVSGPSAKSYLDEEALGAAGISVEWMAYDYAAYPQLHGAFDPHVSVIDLLLNTGPEAGSWIW